MRFYPALLRTALHSPALAAEALYWHVTGRRLRARNRLRTQAVQSPNAYREWIGWAERRNETLAQAPCDIATWPHRPRISVLLYRAPGESEAQYERRLASLEAQVYQDWELVVAQSRESLTARNPAVPRLAIVPGRTDNAAKALGLGLATASCDYVLPLPRDAMLAPDALYWLAKALVENPGARVIYGDEDKISRRGRRSKPWFKPRWNPDLFLAQDYLSGACLVQRQAALNVPASPALAEAGLGGMLLAITRDPEALVVHVPHVLCHHAAPAAQTADDAAPQQVRVAAVAQVVAGEGAKAVPGPFDSVAVEWPLPADQPLVSIIIPTRDRVGLVRTAVSGVLTATRYRNIEVLIVDNGSVEEETLRYFARVSGNPRVRILRHDAPFNYSQLNNLAAREAKGSHLLLLNNDVEIVDENWLTWLMRQALRPGVGAVGALLTYDDGSVQHAGVTVGLGDAAGHAHRFLKPGDPGYFARAWLPHQVSAVTGACLLVEKAKFDAVGGLDETGFAVAFNDVDLCLKLQAAGWRNIYEPRSVLVHHESKSRGKDFRPENIERYRRELALLQQRWSTVGYVDPLHHLALDRTVETYHIAF